MKKLFVIIFLGIAIAACHTSKVSSNKSVPEKNIISNLNGNWQLQMLFASDTNWPKAPFININLDDKIFTGNSGCNSISGKFIITDNYIAFDKNIISTKMACQGSYEKTFLAALLKINQFHITKDELELSQGEIVLLKFKRSSPTQP